MQLINNPLTNPKRYPEINKQYVPGNIGITILISLKNRMINIPQFPDKASTTKINQFSIIYIEKKLLVGYESKVNFKCKKDYCLKVC